LKRKLFFVNEKSNVQLEGGMGKIWKAKKATQGRDGNRFAVCGVKGH